MGVAQNKDISHLIERLEAFEDRLGVSFEGLYASVLTQIDFLKVNGELHPREGTGLNDDIEVVVSLYDTVGRLLGSDRERASGADLVGALALGQSSGAHRRAVPPTTRAPTGGGGVHVYSRYPERTPDV